MDSLGLAAAGYVKDLVDVKIRLARRGRTDGVGVVGLADVQRLAVDIGENDHRLDAHLATGPDDAHGNFATIGDQYSFEHDLYL